MDNAIYAAVALAIILLAAAIIVVWSRRSTWLRTLAIPLALAATATSAATMMWVLGYGVPLIGGITAPPGDAQMLSAKLVQGRGIFVTIDLADEPRLFWLPWDKELAEKLEEMTGNPENGGVIATIPPFEWSWDKQPTFQPMPQPKVLPDKPPEPPKAPSFAA